MIGGPGGGTVIIGEEGKHKTIKHLNKIKRISRLNSDWPCLRDFTSAPRNSKGNGMDFILD